MSCSWLFCNGITVFQLEKTSRIVKSSFSWAKREMVVEKEEGMASLTGAAGREQSHKFGTLLRTSSVKIAEYLVFQLLHCYCLQGII